MRQPSATSLIFSFSFDVLDLSPAMSLSTPTQDDLEELLLSCRYGDVQDIQQFVSNFGPDALATARDDNGNSVLHMVAGNGHTGIVARLVLPSLLHLNQPTDMRKICNRRPGIPPPSTSPLTAFRTQ